MSRMNILIVEDVETKFNDIHAETRAHFGTGINVVRASNLNEAEDLVMSDPWSLLILDLSMDIAASGSMDLGSGHATLAGLDVVERLALMKMKIKTIIITGFDSFQDPDRFDNSIMGVAEVNVIASGMLGDLYLGCVRYGQEDWQVHFQSGLNKGFSS